jgi:chaperonin GroEL (HSP60 family)
LPRIIVDNAGYDGATLIADLHADHTSGKSIFGLGMKFSFLFFIFF